MSKPILYAEDDENDAFFMSRALKDAGILNTLRVVRDGQEARDYLKGVGEFGNRRVHPLPFLIFFDLKLPLVSGLELLSEVRAQERFRHIWMVVLASSRDDHNIAKALNLGADAWMVKPPTGETLHDLARALGVQGFKLSARAMRREEALMPPSRG